DMIHKQQIGHPTEDIVAGLCEGLVRNFLNNVARGKNIQPPIVFLGGVSENVGLRKAFEEALGQKIIVPLHNTVMGALGAALLVKENPPPKTKFSGFEISDKDIRCTSFQCQGCPNHCEVIEARIEGKVVARWGDRCGKWSNLNSNNA
ncbi:MAG: 2-hydroxyglutaryl-CoA dehydratase, partial [Candidatus Nealsonbacteria bacterium CG02_land_8_20_14_3_00_37_10]